MTYCVDTKALRKVLVDNDLLTIEAFSAACGVNRNTCSDVVNGKSYPSSDVMVKMASALNLAGETAGAIFFCPQIT